MSEGLPGIPLGGDGLALRQPAAAAPAQDVDGTMEGAPGIVPAGSDPLQVNLDVDAGEPDDLLPGTAQLLDQLDPTGVLVVDLLRTGGPRPELQAQLHLDRSRISLTSRPWSEFPASEEQHVPPFPLERG